MKLINLDKDKVIILPDRRTAEDIFRTISDRRKNIHYYHPANIILCVMVEPEPPKDTYKFWRGKTTVEAINWELNSTKHWDYPIKEGDIVVLAEEWFNSKDLFFVKSKFEKPINGKYNWQPFSTMPSHLGPNHKITGDCFAVELIETVEDHGEYIRGHVMSMQKKYYFKFMAREINK